MTEVANNLAADVADNSAAPSAESPDPLRRWVRADGSGEFPVEAGRYHLYVSFACPWASHALLMRKLKGLEDVIGLTAVAPDRGEAGWRFTSERPDPVNGWQYLSEGYDATDPTYDDSATVPVLWDKQHSTIVSNDSADIVEMFNSEFNELAERPELDYFPEALRQEIDELNPRIREEVTTGVYWTVFSRSQEEYDANVAQLFASLDWIERRLASRRYLTGEAITSVDWRLAMALFRVAMIDISPYDRAATPSDAYPQLRRYARELYRQPGVAETVNFEEIRRNYSYSLATR